MARISAMVSQGRSESAIQILNWCIELDQNNVDFLLQRADLHLKLQQADETLADYRTLSRLAPDNRRAIDGIQQILAAPDESDLSRALRIPREYTLPELKAVYRREAEHRMRLVNRALEIFSGPVKKMLSGQGKDRDSERYDSEKFVTVFNPFEQLLQSVRYQSDRYGTPFE
jgi:tetratricopeptide (TPR) repeat protein